MAQALDAQKHYAEAETNYRRSIALYLREQKEDGEDVQYLAAKLASVLRNLHKDKEAAEVAAQYKLKKQD